MAGIHHPAPRERPVLATTPDYIYVLGGHTRYPRYIKHTDLWRYNKLTGFWTELVPRVGSLLLPRGESGETKRNPSFPGNSILSQHTAVASASPSSPYGVRILFVHAKNSGQPYDYDFYMLHNNDGSCPTASDTKMVAHGDGEFFQLVRLDAVDVDGTLDEFCFEQDVAYTKMLSAGDGVNFYVFRLRRESNESGEAERCYFDVYHAQIREEGEIMLLRWERISVGNFREN